MKINDKDKKENEREIKKLESYLKKYKKFNDIYIRILAVKMVKSGNTRIKVGEILNKNRKTIGIWVKDYDKEGIEGLIPDYSKCGSKCRLTNEQLIELKEILISPDKNYTIKDAIQIIENKFNVKYSYKQTWEIVRKKLKLNYCKPFIVYNEAPDNADKLLLKNI